MTAATRLRTGDEKVMNSQRLQNKNVQPKLSTDSQKSEKYSADVCLESMPDYPSLALCICRPEYVNGYIFPLCYWYLLLQSPGIFFKQSTQQIAGQM